MLIHLDQKGGEPLYSQISNHLRRLIETDVLKPGVKLPATRELAVDVGVDRTTVIAAYEELVSEGLATAHVGQGTFVAVRARREEQHRKEPDEPLFPEAEVNWDQWFSRSARVSAEWRTPDLSSYQPSGEVISFTGGMPDSSLFPIDAFRRVLNEVLRTEGHALLQYSPASGYPPCGGIWPTISSGRGSSSTRPTFSS